MKKLPEAKRRIQVAVCCTPDLLQRIDAQAARESRSRSSMLERMLWRDMTEQLKVDKELAEYTPAASWPPVPLVSD